MRVRSAHVSTLGANAVDAFYVTGPEGAPLPGDEAAAVARKLEETLRGVTRPPDPGDVVRGRDTLEGDSQLPPTPRTATAVFDTLSDRLSATFKNLRGKGRLSEADIDATAREIRIALLEADVALPVVRTFIKNVKERALGAEVSKALNPAQQVLKIVNDELVTHPRRRDPAPALRQAAARP